MSSSSTPGGPSPAKVPTPKPKKAAATGPKTIDMLVEAISTLNERKGASIQAIKSYILEKYPNVDPSRLRTSLKKAVVSGMESGVIIRPKATEASGASLTGRLKVDKAKVAALKKEKKPKVAKPVSKPKKPRSTSKSPKKALAKSKKPTLKKTEKPKSKTLTKTKPDKAKLAKKPAAKTTKTPKPKEPKKPKAPKTPAKAKAAKATKTTKAKKT